MYVCSCNVFTEADVKAVAGLAGDSVAAVYHCLGCRPRCGGCVFTIRKILDEVREETGCDCAGRCPEDDAACPAVERAMELVQHFRADRQSPPDRQAWAEDSCGLAAVRE